MDYIKHFKKYGITAVIFLTIGAFIGIIPYMMVYTVISRFINGETVTALWATLMAAGVAVCLVLKTYSTNKGLMASHFFAYNILCKIRTDLADKLLRMPMGKIIEKGSGELKKAFVENIEDMELILAHTLPEGISNTLVFLLTTCALLIADWRMALCSLAVLPVGVTAAAAMLKTGRTRMRPYYDASRKMNESIVEYISGMEVIRVFGQTNATFQRYKESVETYKQRTLEWFRVSWNYMSVYSVFLPSTLCFMLPFGILSFLDGRLSLNSFVLCCLMAISIGPPMLRMVEFVPMLPQLKVKAEKLAQLFAEKDLPEGKINTMPQKHDIKAEHITFSYGGKNVLNGISFLAEENTITAFVGESGAGKSTVARLLVRFWDTGGGCIRIGGIDIREFTYQTLSDLVSYVSQDVFLFNTSILENIRMGRPNASDDEVVAAAKAAQCHEFIMKYQNGYHTVAGDSGDKLSGGQRQRISIARAVLKDSPIIILDEATSSTDPENEDKIQRSLNRLIQGKTLIVIAHRLSTIRHADNIFVLEGGDVAAQGTHEDLLLCSPQYRRMWGAYSETAGEM